MGEGGAGGGMVAGGKTGAEGKTGEWVDLVWEEVGLVVAES